MIGTIGNTQGVSSDSAPIDTASQRNAPQESALAPNDAGGARREAGDARCSGLEAGSRELGAGSWEPEAGSHFTGTVTATVFGGRHRRFVQAWKVTSMRSVARPPGASAARRTGITNVNVPSWVSVWISKFGSNARAGSGERIAPLRVKG